MSEYTDFERQLMDEVNIAGAEVERLNVELRDLRADNKSCLGIIAERNAGVKRLVAIEKATRGLLDAINRWQAWPVSRSSKPGQGIVDDRIKALRDAMR